MKKLVIILSVLLFVLTGATGYLLLKKVPKALEEMNTQTVKKINNKEGEYSVYQNNNFLQTFSSWNDAYDFANKYIKTHITKKGSSEWLWDNYPSFSVFHNSEEFYFASLTDALGFARERPGSRIANRANKTTIWDSSDSLPRSHIIQNVPIIAQYPELPRGCEVTSLCMLLNYYGIGVDKMTLAEEIFKDPTQFSRDKNGIVTFGNPSYGFVGNMYDKSQEGLGVYNEPLFDLLRSYIGTDALNISGSKFTDLYFFLAKNKPVVVITNYTFKPLTQDKFETWLTPTGQAIITRSMHAVTVVGYDNSYIYFNDPLKPDELSKADIADFVLSWEQMGKQAITYY